MADQCGVFSHVWYRNWNAEELEGGEEEQGRKEGRKKGREEGMKGGREGGREGGRQGGRDRGRKEGGKKERQKERERDGGRKELTNDEGMEGWKEGGRKKKKKERKKERRKEEWGRKILIAMLCKGKISSSLVGLSRYACLPFGSLPSLCPCGGPLSVFRFAWRADFLWQTSAGFSVMSAVGIGTQRR